jgi:hypothetical protein
MDYLRRHTAPVSERVWHALDEAVAQAVTCSPHDASPPSTARTAGITSRRGWAR